VQDENLERMEAEAQTRQQEGDRLLVPAQVCPEGRQVGQGNRSFSIRPLRNHICGVVADLGEDQGGTNAPPEQLVFDGEESWGTGSNVQTSLVNKEGEVRFAAMLASTLNHF